jgi:L-fuconate dehydratase
MASQFSTFETHDVRFPTSVQLDGSDAMNPDPDYSAAYVVIGTDAGDGLEGHGFAFTCGRGNEIVAAGIRALQPLVVDLPVEDALDDLGDVWKRLTRETQLRWLGPEKGVMHMAVAAVINALWDLKAKREGKPLWQVLSQMPPEQLVDLVDFRYLTDLLTPSEAREILTVGVDGREDRSDRLMVEGYPAYATSPGWIGYSDEKLAQLCREAVASGFDHVKLKVGRSLDEDVRRCRIAREALGPDVLLSIDANQRWDVDEAIAWVRALEPFDLHWVEEPTSPDDILGHALIREGVAPLVATGEHVQNRIVFKQMLKASAIDVVQIDACRVGGVNENIAVLLMAAKLGVPVCPHAGGVGLCEAVQHLAMFDFVAVSGRLEGRAIEYVDHLHEEFVDPVIVREGRYVAPTAPGASTTMRSTALKEYAFPDGPYWSMLPTGAAR